MLAKICGIQSYFFRPRIGNKSMKNLVFFFTIWVVILIAFVAISTTVSAPVTIAITICPINYGPDLMWNMKF